MGQSSYKWVITIDDSGDVRTLAVISTPEDLPNVVDFTENIVSIVRIGFEVELALKGVLHYDTR